MISNWDTTSNITESDDPYAGLPPLAPLSAGAPGLAADVFAVPDTLALIELINFLVCGLNGVNSNASQTLITSSYYDLPSISLAYTSPTLANTCILVSMS